MVWGVTFIAQRSGLEHSGPLWFAAVRVAIGALVLAPLLVIAPRLDRRGHGVALVLGLTQVAAFTALQVGGLATVGAGPAAAIIYTQPLIVLIGARVALHEPLTARRIAGALLGFAGVALVSARELSLGSRTGAFLLLAGALAWATGTVITKAVSGQPPLTLVVFQHLWAAPVLLAVAALFELPPAPNAPLALTVVYAGVFGSALAWFLFTVLLGRGDAGVVSTWLFSVPILAAALGVLVLGEPLALSLVAGIVLVAAGVRLAASSQPAGR